MTDFYLNCFDKYKGWAPLALRLVAGFIFIMSGFGKLSNIAGITGSLTNWGFPAAAFLAWVLALTEFFGGILLILGLGMRWAAGLLAIIMLVATITHLINAFGDYKYPLIIFAGLLALLFMGAGKLSADGVLGK